MDAGDIREALRDDDKSLADLAEDKGKSVDGLKQALRDEIRKDADKAVDSGDLTKEQADRVVDKLSAAVDDFVDQTGGPHFGFGTHGPEFGPLGPPGKGFLPGFLPGADLMETAADYLGVDTADVRKALRDGKPLGELAKEKGKSVDGLEDALRDQLRKDADKAVDNGDLTKKQADQIVEKMGSAIDELVEEGNFKFEFHLRTRPGDPVPLPVPERKDHSSFELPGVSSRPI
jgi:polyhydroxyalkanoate synthesis regulator phasin